VPSGPYDAFAKIDLPGFGRIRGIARLEIRQPPDNVLEVRLRELRGDDVAKRRHAAEDLRHFWQDGKTVAPALLEAVSDEDETVRLNAITSLQWHTVHLGEDGVERMLKIAADTEEEIWPRTIAAWVYARSAPTDAASEAALKRAIESAEGPLREHLEQALDQLRQRRKWEARREE
jgi:HEAT repeat protein